jgi:Zn-dependent protease with chaperone function
MTDQGLAAARWTALSAAERETFFAAIARHRRASWRVTAACAVAVAALAATVAILMAPLLYCLLALALDLVNFVTPTPDLMVWMGRMLDPLFSSPRMPVALAVRDGALAAVPGVILMALATLGLRRIWRRSPLFDAGDVPGRPPDRSHLAEQRLANVVEEMAIAAGIPPPRVIIVPGGANAAACGRDERHVTILAGETLVGAVDREELEGLVAHLIGSIADGDMTIGLRVTTTLALFGLVSRIGGSLTDRHALRWSVELWRLVVAPTSRRTAEFLGSLADPFRKDPAEERPSTPSGANGSLTWREWLLMPLIGPVGLAGFLSGMLTGFLLDPLIALAWRQRKYMADATAVQLTRDPDGLARALKDVADHPQGIAPWTAHLAVAGGRGALGPFGLALVPIFPSEGRRVAALVRMGAHVALEPRSRVPWWLMLVFVLFLSILASLMGVVVYLLVIVSTALSGLFTVVPAGLLHLLLRWLAS